MIRSGEDSAFAVGVGGGDDAFGFHLVYQGGGFVVADAQVALDGGYGGFLRAQNDGDCFVKQGVLAAVAAADAAVGIAAQIP